VNIFVTNTDVKQCAADHCHVHQTKMIVEYAQLMSTVKREHGITDGVYMPTHKNHPSTRWVRERPGNYQWLYELWRELCSLYTKRTGKTHLTQSRCHNLAIKCSSEPIFDYAMLAMPFEHKQANVVESYRSYMNAKFTEWLARPKPMKLVFDKKPSWCTIAY